MYMSCVCALCATTYLFRPVTVVDLKFLLDELLADPLAHYHGPSLRHHPVVKALLPKLFFSEINSYLPTIQPISVRGRAGVGYLVADAVSTHISLVLSPSTSLLCYLNLFSQRRGDLDSGGGGLDGHHPGLMAFLTNTHATTLQFWRRRRLERHCLCLLLGTLIILNWASPRGSPFPRVPQAPLCGLDIRLLLLGLHGVKLVFADEPAALLVVLSRRSPILFHLVTHGFSHGCPQVPVYQSGVLITVAHKPCLMGSEEGSVGNLLTLLSEK